MKLLEAIRRVDRSKANTVYVGEAFYNDIMGRDVWMEKDAPRIQAYQLIGWNCTDTTVGLVVYYLDDQPLATSYQNARKSSEDFEYVSAEIHAEARAYVAELLNDKPDFKILNLNSEIGEHFQVSYREGVIYDFGEVRGRRAKFMRQESRRWVNQNVEDGKYGHKFPGRAGNTYRESIAVVQYDDGEMEAIDVTEFNIPIRIV